MKRFIKFLLKLVIPPAIRKKIRFLLNLESYFEERMSQIKMLDANFNEIYSKINNIQQEVGKTLYRLYQLQNIMVTKENAPLVFDKLKVPLINDHFFADIVAKDFKLKEFTNMQNDFWNNARLLVLGFSQNLNGIPLDTVREYLLNLVQIRPVCERVFYCLLEILVGQYEDDSNEENLEKAYNYLIFDEKSDKNLIVQGILKYICFLMQRNNIEKAKEIFLRNKNYFSNEVLASFLPAAYVAHDCGVINEDIYLSSEIYKRFKSQTTIYEEFEKYIRGNSIAIVGNGPHEMNTGHGNDIDDHDIVVRFNNFVINDSYKKDYGVKVNIVCTASPNIENTIQSYHYHADFNIFTMSMYRLPFTSKMRKFILDNPEKKMLDLDNKCVTFFQNKYNCHFPTSGLRVAWLFRNYLSICKSIDFYGMSIKAVLKNHYYENIVRLSPNDLSLEHEIFNDLFKDTLKN